MISGLIELLTHFPAGTITLKALERLSIIAALNDCTNKTKAAKMLGVSRHTFYRMLRRHDIGETKKYVSRPVIKYRIEHLSGRYLSQREFGCIPEWTFTTQLQFNSKDEAEQFLKTWNVSDGFVTPFNSPQPVI